MATMIPTVNPFEEQNIEKDIPVAVTPSDVFSREQPAIVPQNSGLPRATSTTYSPASNFPQNTTSLPSPRKKNLGLSELSKQLRALQAKNEIQSVEIEARDKSTVRSVEGADCQSHSSRINLFSAAVRD
jgi:hypothetical protein